MRVLFHPVDIPSGFDCNTIDNTTWLLRHEIGTFTSRYRWSKYVKIQIK